MENQIELNPEPPKIEFWEDPNFYGTYEYIRTLFSYMTEGVYFMCEELKCYWLIDVINSYIPSLEMNEFYVCKFILNDDRQSGTFTIDDGDDNIIITQNIMFTDITANVRLFLTTAPDKESVILLPSEY
jgi:hypothetical protein